jgi:hypothetical protein
MAVVSGAKEIGNRLGISESTLMGKIRSGEIEAKKEGGIWSVEEVIMDKLTGRVFKKKKEKAKKPVREAKERVSTR